MLFHSLQSGQRPIHLGLLQPHAWQTNRVVDFAITPFFYQSNQSSFRYNLTILSDSNPE
jgi:hypothetical protein